MNRERGQSLAEFAVAASVSALLLLGTIAIAGYQEVDRRTLMAARHAAWQGTWLADRTAAAVQAEGLHRWHFADHGLAQPVGSDAYVASRDVDLQIMPALAGGLAGTASQALLEPLQVAGGFLGGGFDLPRDELHGGIVRARIRPMRGMPPPFDAFDLSLQAPFALLGDAWHAAGVAQVRERTGGLVPASRLGDLRTLWRPLQAPLSLVEPSIAEFCPGVIEPDRVPEDRLGPGRTPLLGRCP